MIFIICQSCSLVSICVHSCSIRVHLCSDSFGVFDQIVRMCIIFRTAHIIKVDVKSVPHFFGAHNKICG